LRRISTKENLSPPQALPENWGSIFGLHGIKDKLGDLSWIGDPDLVNTGWFETDIPAPLSSSDGVSKGETAWNTSKELLKDSDWAMLPDVPMTSGKKKEWEDYRRYLREIKLQSGFPDNIIWPNKPE
jgi:hypothetical protein